MIFFKNGETRNGEEFLRSEKAWLIETRGKWKFIGKCFVTGVHVIVFNYEHVSCSFYRWPFCNVHPAFFTVFRSIIVVVIV